MISEDDKMAFAKTLDRKIFNNFFDSISIGLIEIFDYLKLGCLSKGNVSL